MKSMVRIFKEYWWALVIILIFSPISAWAIYLWKNCHLWENSDCLGFQGKTVLEVAELFIIPIALVIIAFILDNREKKADREMVLDNQRETILQNYLDTMGKFIIDRDLRTSNQDDDVRVLAQAKTLMAIERLDKERKSKLIEFLSDASLFKRDKDRVPIIHLRLANLEGINLPCGRLAECDLLGANLKNSWLPAAELQKADLTMAELHGATLNGAHLEKANMPQAVLKKAVLKKAFLVGTNLEGANLKNAVLEGANLSGAKLESANLKEAKLKGANMPDGKVYDPKIHTVENLTSR